VAGSDIERLAGHAAAIDRVVAFARSFDDRDWRAMRACLADAVDTDYSSFRGTPPARIAADEFVRLRERGLAGLVTQHLTANHRVERAGEGVCCTCDFVIHRWPEDPADTRRLHSYGRYRFDLVRSGDGYLIAGIVQTVVRSEGDPALHGALRPQGTLRSPR